MKNLLLAVASWSVLSLAASSAGTLDMYWIDVEGGAATLVVTPAGESLLIDSGMPGERDPKRILAAAKIAGLKQIDHLITTHFHIDHYGGAADLAKLIPIINVWDNGIPEKNPDNPSDTTSFARMIAPYREMKVATRHLITPGTEIPLRQAAGAAPLTLRCLATMQEIDTDLPPRRVNNSHCEAAKEKPRDSSDNANSTVFLLKLGNFEMFDGGDLTWNTEAKLVCPSDLVGTIDVYDVNHHGLDTSNNPLLVRTLAPTVAVMSNGTTKGCGAETFQTLKSTSSIAAIYQIHKNLREDQHNNTVPEHIANLEKDCQANYIKVSVEPDGKTYTVSIPATGHSRTFQTR